MQHASILFVFSLLKKKKNGFLFFPKKYIFSLLFTQYESNNIHYNGFFSVRTAAVTGFAHAYRIPWERVFSPIFIHPPPVTPPKTSPQTGHVSVDFIRTYTPIQYIYINMYIVCVMCIQIFTHPICIVYMCMCFFFYSSQQVLDVAGKQRT